MEILGIIPARGGSKGIPDKNITPVLGRPLLAYTCEAALNSSGLNRVILSTDDSDIAHVAASFNIEIPFLRPAELAQDDTPSLPVLQHAVRWLHKNEGYIPDAIMILQPTSPLRTSNHIDEVVELMDTTGADTIVSVTEVPHRFNPISLMMLDDERRLKSYVSGDMVLRRQDKPLFYARNGPAVLLVKIDTLMNDESLYGDNTQPYLMNELDSFDVDTLDDILIIEALLKHLR